MDFTIKDLKNSIVDLSRKIGYVIIDTNERGEYNMVRKLQFGNYPRFHVYLRQSFAGAQDKLNTYVFNLHLDQKKPIYGARGVHAHNGEYFGPVVETESDRIKQILQ
ncbi:MAG: hypothetical protein NTY81_00105 [Candidatus Staskawiczbacteria bacterium]|nr:hypothetical protein [Candidatus Staskawiczbacteria bacterium]